VLPVEEGGLTMDEKPEIDRLLFYSSPDLERKPFDEKSKIEGILEWFEGHMASEKSMISEYQTVASKTRNETIRFLINLITEEEEKHHRLLQVMIQTLRESLTWQSHSQAIHFHGDLGVDKEEVRKATEKFLTQEREGIQKCKALRKETKKLYYGLFEILFDVMIKDSEKHEHLLKYMNKTLNVL
jgi:rubrerythrin